MKKTDNPDATPNVDIEFDNLVRNIRPELHRYCAHMVGSVIDGEDVLQDALTRAYQSLSSMAHRENLRGWLFRIAHNKAIDSLRKFEHKYFDSLDNDDVAISSEEQPLENAELVNMAMQVFLELTPKQRGCVLLKDVMSYSLAEIADILDMNVASVKAALNRGRTRLRALSRGFVSDEPKPMADVSEHVFLKKYVDSFNARDFDALRALLAEDVQCDLVGMTQRHGADAVGGYYNNYNAKDDWRLAIGFVETYPAILVYDPRSDENKVEYCMLLRVKNSIITHIRDFRYARYIMDYAEISELASDPR